MQNTYYGIEFGKKQIGFGEVKYGSYGAAVLVMIQKTI